MLQWILACAATGPAAWAHAAERRLSTGKRHAFNLPLASDLRSDGARSKRERLPVLLFFEEAINTANAKLRASSQAPAPKPAA
jgi:hypothetical protein